MYDSDAEFSLTWTPPRYSSYASTSKGAWRVVLDGDQPVGVVWMMSEPAGAGVVWVTQTEAIEKLRQHFIDGVNAGTPAYAAYNAASLVPGVKLAPEQFGVLSGVDDNLQSMMNEA